jgi:hypothetical protein
MATITIPLALLGVKDVLTYGFKCQDNTKYDHEIMDFWILSL